MGRPASTPAPAPAGLTADRFAEMLGECWTVALATDEPSLLIRPLEQLVCAGEATNLRTVAAKIAIARNLAEDVLDEDRHHAREMLERVLLALDTSLVALARIADVRGVAAERYSLELERALKPAPAAA